MTDENRTRPRASGARLGAELRRLRKLAGLSGRDMAQQVGVGQATISRIENAQSLPSLPEVTAWAAAVDASERTREHLVALTEAALTEVDSWRTRIRSGLATIQADAQVRESMAGTIRHFQPSVVPGLLQTAQYAQQVFRMTDLFGSLDHATAVAARLQRQQALYDESHRFEFIITEQVLRRRYVPTAALVAQLDRIANIATLDHVAIRVLPDDAEPAGIVWGGFDLFEDRVDGLPPIVKIETPHAGFTVSEPADVAIYRDQLALLRSASVSGESAIKLIMDIARKLRPASHS